MRDEILYERAVGIPSEENLVWMARRGACKIKD